MKRAKKIRRVLIVGSGGREVALYQAICRSPSVERVYVAPGNNLIPKEDRLKVPYDSGRYGNLILAALSRHVDLVVVGPDEPVVAGIWDAFHISAPSIPVMAPSRAAARLEGSKIFCKELCRKYGIPTGHFQVARNGEEAGLAIRTFLKPPVIKADGLCEGKGVHVSVSEHDANQFAQHLLFHKKKGEPILVEERLEGYELSVTALCDGKHAMLLPTARDYKRLHAGSDLMTGGMGAYSPVAEATQRLLEKIRLTIIEPLLAAMHAEGTPYHGVLYAGIMVTKDGPKLIEINCRFGDPEAQVILPRIGSDIVPYLWATTQHGRLGSMRRIKINSNAAVCVCLASLDYPQAGHRLESIVGTGRTVAWARKNAYKKVKARPGIENLQYRDDIAAGV